MEFKVELIRRRERRALVVIAAALAAIVAVSIAYLRAATPAAAPSAPIVGRVDSTVTYYQPAAYFVVPGTGRPTGGYFVWHLESRGGSGGRAPSP
jgi:hypothetical protein